MLGRDRLARALAQQVAAAVAATYNVLGGANWRAAEPQTVRPAGSVMGPTLTIYSPSPIDDALLIAVDAVLHAECDSVQTTRKGRVFSVHLDGRPYDVSIEGAGDSPDPLPSGMSSAVCIAAGCNQPIDHELMLRLAGQIALEVGGEVAPPQRREARTWAHATRGSGAKEGIGE